ncbi:MAG TPA: MraY family glycosyltransferase [Solirubrobacteraceae bacterium]|jgi:UDP-GlcNAc:undecaprenyl-phosphate GlcNAc-1-phosphate transferase|nr:MraY family glycosyltransferase [Solirubrobacteraceae bacterium]
MLLDAGSVVIFVLAAVGVQAACPVAMGVAHRTGFYDRPAGYKQHSRPTPYLGGVAVLAGFLIGTLVVVDLERFWVLVACMVALAVVGTVDDRRKLGALPRVGAELMAAAALWEAGLGWRLSLGAGVDLAVTIVWVVGVVNAFNLMDNLDGAAGTLGLVCGLGTGALALLHHDAGLAALAFALSGSCAGFLRFNLTTPAQIFLGDGGSMSLGIIAAATAAGAASGASHPGGLALLTGALLVGLVILDTTLVTISRTRRRVRVLTGGRDHLTHRLLQFIHKPAGVALALAVAQFGLCGCAIIADQSEAPLLVAISTGCSLLGVLAIVLLEALWTPNPQSKARMTIEPAPLGPAVDPV